MRTPKVYYIQILERWKKSVISRGATRNTKVLKLKKKCIGENTKQWESKNFFNE